MESLVAVLIRPKASTQGLIAAPNLLRGMRDTASEQILLVWDDGGYTDTVRLGSRDPPPSGGVVQRLNLPYFTVLPRG
jgi:hypothetical protein